MKNLLLTAAMVFMSACSACGPAELKVNDSVEVEPYPWALDECSQVVGAQPCNFELRDQNDVLVNLYDFYGSTVVLDLSAMWCGPCNVAGMDVQATVERFAEHDVRYITVLIDNSQGQPPSLTDAQNWATNLGIETEPVLQGSRDLLSSDPTSGWPLESWPTFIMITSDMEIYYFQKGYNQQVLDMLIEDTISQSQ
tara:strand:- start:325 stop:912 length:588 start_codon:yes stop_codon:yes gene_type:complete